MPSRPSKLAIMRDLDTIDSELRLLVAVRRVCRELDGNVGSTRLIDELLDERGEVTAISLATLGYCNGD
jgi:hypothetical protein